MLWAWKDLLSSYARHRVSPQGARWLCRRCLPVCGSPTPALGCVALTHTRPRRNNPQRSRWDRMCPHGHWSHASARRTRLKATRTVCPRNGPPPNPTSTGIGRGQSWFELPSRLRAPSAPTECAITTDRSELEGFRRPSSIATAPATTATAAPAVALATHGSRHMVRAAALSGGRPD